MSSINCPHCGAHVAQADALNKIQTCKYCSQTFLVEAKPEKQLALIHHGQMIKWRGKQYKPQGFIQFKHDEGYRTEWHVLDDKNASYWLSVDDENLFLMQDKSCDTPFPQWEALQVNTQLVYQDETYLVTEKRVLHYFKVEGIASSKPTASHLKYTYLTGQDAKCLLLIFNQHSNQQSVSCRQGYWLDPFDIKVI